jgi:hypothetical protein
MVDRSEKERDACDDVVAPRSCGGCGCGERAPRNDDDE